MVLMLLVSSSRALRQLFIMTASWRSLDRTHSSFFGRMSVANVLLQLDCVVADMSVASMLLIIHHMLAL